MEVESGKRVMSICWSESESETGCERKGVRRAKLIYIRSSNSGEDYLMEMMMKKKKKKKKKKTKMTMMMLHIIIIIAAHCKWIPECRCLHPSFWMLYEETEQEDQSGTNAIRCNQSKSHLSSLSL